MQKTANKVAKTTIELNEADMAEKTQTVIDINRQRGVMDPTEVNVSRDARYNTFHIANRKKPGQNASQSVSLAIETITDKQ